MMTVLTCSSVPLLFLWLTESYRRKFWRREHDLLYAKYTRLITDYDAACKRLINELLK